MEAEPLWKALVTDSSLHSKLTLVRDIRKSYQGRRNENTMIVFSTSNLLHPIYNNLLHGQIRHITPGATAARDGFGT